LDTANWGSGKDEHHFVESHACQQVVRHVVTTQELHVFSGTLELTLTINKLYIYILPALQPVVGLYFAAL